METTLANSVFANGVAVLRTMTEGLSPAVENKHIIFMKKIQESKETVYLILSTKTRDFWKQYAMSLHVCCLKLYSQHSS